jgi:C-terminal processing protease CtpA/Prc
VGSPRVLPLAVLVHGTTRSAAEVMAGTLQNTGRTCLIGGRTAGDTGYPKEMVLPGGGSIGVTQGMCIFTDGSAPGRIGRGYVPDVVVSGSGWDEVTVEKDPAMAKAIEVLTIPSLRARYPIGGGIKDGQGCGSPCGSTSAPMVTVI